MVLQVKVLRASKLNSRLAFCHQVEKDFSGLCVGSFYSWLPHAVDSIGVFQPGLGEIFTSPVIGLLFGQDVLMKEAFVIIGGKGLIPQPAQGMIHAAQGLDDCLFLPACDRSGVLIEAHDLPLLSLERCRAGFDAGPTFQ